MKLFNRKNKKSQEEIVRHVAAEDKFETDMRLDCIQRLNRPKNTYEVTTYTQLIKVFEAIGYIYNEGACNFIEYTGEYVEYGRSMDERLPTRVIMVIPKHEIASIKIIYPDSTTYVGK
jgi:hypothetical protein